MKRFVDAHYVVAAVDTGRMNKNLQVPGRNGLTKLDGLPSVLIVDPKNGRPLDQGHTPALAHARHMSGALAGKAGRPEAPVRPPPGE